MNRLAKRALEDFNKVYQNPENTTEDSKI